MIQTENLLEEVLPVIVMYAPVPDSAKEKLEMCWITVRKPTKEDKCQLILHFSFYFRQKNF